MHALSRCDTNGVLSRMGNRTAYYVCTKHADALEGLQKFQEDDTFLDSARQFVLFTYGKKAKDLSSLNKLRFLLVTTTDKPAYSMPPTENALVQHVFGAKYQVMVWCHIHIPKPEVMDPVSHGWYLNDQNELQPIFFKNESAPVEVRDITHLFCTDKSCERQKCQCMLTCLECIGICTSSGECDNPNNRREGNEKETEDECAEAMD